MRIPTFADSARREAKINALKQAGVTIIDPNNTYIEDKVSVGEGTTIYPGVTLEGATTIGRNCVIGPYNYIADSRITDNCRIGTFCKIENSVINPECEIEDKAQIKRSFLGMGVKAHHWCCILDAQVGARCNIGAGTIFCNYDGVNKNKIVLEKAVFVGADTKLVAPVRVGKYAYIGAGSVVTKDVPGATPQTNNRGTLVLARGQQDKNLTKAVKLILELLRKTRGQAILAEEATHLLEQAREQVHKIGYVRYGKDGWHLEKPKT